MNIQCKISKEKRLYGSNMKRRYFYSTVFYVHFQDAGYEIVFTLLTNGREKPNRCVFYPWIVQLLISVPAFIPYVLNWTAFGSEADLKRQTNGMRPPSSFSVLLFHFTFLSEKFSRQRSEKLGVENGGKRVASQFCAKNTSVREINLTRCRLDELAVECCSGSTP